MNWQLTWWLWDIEDTKCPFSFISWYFVCSLQGPTFCLWLLCAGCLWLLCWPSLFQHFIHCAVSLVISSFSGDVYPLLPPSFSHCLLRSDLAGLRQVPILRFLQIPEYVSNPLSWSPPSFWRRILLSIFVPLPFYTAHWQLSPNIYLFVAILFNLPIMQLGCTGWVNISKPIS